MDPTDRRIMFIVNPNSQGGKTKSNWDKWEKIAKKILSSPFDFILSDGVGTGTEKTMDAIHDGYNSIISVGGEGTTNEVINGVYTTDPTVSVGFLRSGTANDFLSPVVYNWPEDITDQFAAIERGKTWQAPINKVQGDSLRYGINVATAGIGSKISYDASIKRRFKWIKSDFKYTLLAILNALTWKNNPAVVKFDGNELEGGLTLYMSGYAKQAGGFITLPQAELFDKKMGYLFVRDMSKVGILKLLTTVKKGEHSEEIEGIHMGHASKIFIETENPILFEVDGEPFSFETNKIEIEGILDGVPIIDYR